MGQVFVAEHVAMGKRAVVKVLLPSLSSNQELVSRFFNEARAATRISHPGIVDVYDFGSSADGRAFIVMELLEGEPLSNALHREGPLDIARIARLGTQMCDALGAAHAQGIVHRDLKPENVFLARDSAVPGGERAKILDFGIAKLEGDGEASLKTRTGALLGTPTYMSPEQCKGAGAIDWRSDIYAIGCILFEMLTGRPPFSGGGFGEIISAHIANAPPRASALAENVPPELDELLARTLAKDVRERPQSMHEIAHALSLVEPSLHAHGSPAAGYAPGAPHPSAAQGVSASAPPLPVAANPSTLQGAAGVQAPTEAGSSAKWTALAVASVVALAVAAVVTIAVVFDGGEGAASAPAANADAAGDVEEIDAATELTADDRWDEALEERREALGVDALGEQASSLSAQAISDGKDLFGQAEYEEAIERFLDAYAYDPYVDSLFNLGYTYYMIGECQAAAFFVQRTLRKGESEDLLDKAEMLAGLIDDEGDCEPRAPELDGVVGAKSPGDDCPRDCNPAKRDADGCCPDYTGGDEPGAAEDAQVERAQEAARAGNFERALELCEAVAQRTPDHAEANMVCLISACNLGNVSRAEHYMSRVGEDQRVHAQQVCVRHGVHLGEPMD